jgi:hypothetical protein
VYSHDCVGLLACLDHHQLPHEDTYPRLSRAGALSNVLNSLNKLVELEKRITNLEQNNFYGETLNGRESSHWFDAGWICAEGVAVTDQGLSNGKAKGLVNKVVSISKRKKGTCGINLLQSRTGRVRVNSALQRLLAASRSRVH